MCMKKNFILFSAVLLLFLSVVPSSAVQRSSGINTLIVEALGFRSDKGQAYVGLYNSENGFPSDPDKAFRSAFVPIKNGNASFWFAGIPAGTYAVIVYHDENGNKKFDINLFPFSMEGGGASNGAKGMFGPPSFKDASFNLDKFTKKIQIKISY